MFKDRLHGLRSRAVRTGVSVNSSLFSMSLIWECCGDARESASSVNAPLTSHFFQSTAESRRTKWQSSGWNCWYFSREESARSQYWL